MRRNEPVCSTRRAARPPYWRIDAVLSRFGDRHHYAVDGAPADQLRAATRLKLAESGYQFAINDLTRAECLVPAFGANAGDYLFRFFEFFHSKNLRTVALTSAMYARLRRLEAVSRIRRWLRPSRSRRYCLPTPCIPTAAVEIGLRRVPNERSSPAPASCISLWRSYRRDMIGYGRRSCGSRRRRHAAAWLPQSLRLRRLIRWRA